MGDGRNVTVPPPCGEATSGFFPLCCTGVPPPTPGRGPPPARLPTAAPAGDAALHDVQRDPQGDRPGGAGRPHPCRRPPGNRTGPGPERCGPIAKEPSARRGSGGGRRFARGPTPPGPIQGIVSIISNDHTRRVAQPAVLVTLHQIMNEHYDCAEVMEVWPLSRRRLSCLSPVITPPPFPGIFF